MRSAELIDLDEKPRAGLGKIGAVVALSAIALVTGIKGSSGNRTEAKSTELIQVAPAVYGASGLEYVTIASADQDRPKADKLIEIRQLPGAYIRVAPEIIEKVRLAQRLAGYRLGGEPQNGYDNGVYLYSCTSPGVHLMSNKEDIDEIVQLTAAHCISAVTDSSSGYEVGLSAKYKKDPSLYMAKLMINSPPALDFHKITEQEKLQIGISKPGNLSPDSVVVGESAYLQAGDLAMLGTREAILNPVGDSQGPDVAAESLTYNLDAKEPKLLLGEEVVIVSYPAGGGQMEHVSRAINLGEIQFTMKDGLRITSLVVGIKSASPDMKGIRPGASGSVVVNSRGEIVGVVSMALFDNYSDNNDDTEFRSSWEKISGIKLDKKDIKTFGFITPVSPPKMAEIYKALGHDYAPIDTFDKNKLQSTIPPQKITLLNICPRHFCPNGPNKE